MHEIDACEGEYGTRVEMANTLDASSWLRRYDALLRDRVVKAPAIFDLPMRVDASPEALPVPRKPSFALFVPSPIPPVVIAPALESTPVVSAPVSLTFFLEERSYPLALPSYFLSPPPTDVDRTDPVDMRVIVDAHEGEGYDVIFSAPPAPVSLSAPIELSPVPTSLSAPPLPIVEESRITSISAPPLPVAEASDVGFANPWASASDELDAAPALTVPAGRPVLRACLLAAAAVAAGLALHTIHAATSASRVSAPLPNVVAEVTPKPLPVASVAPAAQKLRGRLFVSAPLQAPVFLDGMERGVGPSLKFDVAPGYHVVRVGKDQTRTVEVRADQVATVDLTRP
jgi:hypothetical protein